MVFGLSQHRKKSEEQVNIMPRRLSTLRAWLASSRAAFPPSHIVHRFTSVEVRDLSKTEELSLLVMS